MDVEKERQEYQQMKDWLAGKKPRAAGRSWRRAARAVVPTALRVPLERTWGIDVGDGLGLLLVGAMPWMPFLMASFVLDVVIPTMSMEALDGSQALVLIESQVRTLIGFLRPVALVFGVLGFVAQMVRMVLCGRA